MSTAEASNVRDTGMASQLGDRFLHRELRSQARHAGQLLELLSFSFECDVTACVATFQREIRPSRGALRQHFVLDSARLTTWPVVKQEVESARGAQGTNQSGPVPSNFDGLHQALTAMGITLPTGRDKGTCEGQTKTKGTSKPTVQWVDGTLETR